MRDDTEKSLHSLLSRRTALKAGVLGAAGVVLAGSVPGSAAAQGASGGQLVIGKPSDVLDFDPMVSASQTTWEIQAVIYESLVFLDDNLNPKPGLAESWATPNDTTYVFSIRKGVKFHNGREMTAEDVVFSLQRVLDTLHQPDTWWYVKMGPTGPSTTAAVSAAATATAKGTPTTAPPSVGLTFKATGPYEVTATLTEPYAPFLQALSATPTSIVPSKEVQSGAIDLTKQMVGTGPFAVSEHVEDQHWIFKKFDGYWGGPPKLDQVVWKIMPDESSRLAALRTGELQLAFFDNAKLLDVVKNDPNVTTEDQLTTNYYVLFVNAKKPELSDERVRQAISLAVDREQIKQLALFGHASATGPIAAGFKQLATPLSDVPFYTRDVKRAKALLAEAGKGGGLKLQILVTPDLSATVTMAELMKQQLAEAGIQLDIVQRDLATFVNEYATEGSSQLAISWWAGYSDPYLILVELQSGLADFIGLHDSTLDELIAQAARETDPTKRLTVLKKLESRVATLGNFQPLVTRNNFVAYRKDQIANVSFAAADGFGLPLWHRIQAITRVS